MSDNSTDDGDIDVEAVETVLSETLLAVKTELKKVEGAEVAENNTEGYLSVRYPTENEPVVDKLLKVLASEYDFDVDKGKTRKTGMSALKISDEQTN